MKILADQKYLIFPVNTTTVSKKVEFYHNSKLVFELDVNIDAIAPNFFAYINVERFMGKELEIVTVPHLNYEIKKADAITPENLYNEPYRPQLHYSVKNGWNNDPNGLIKYKDTYHAFYQYNPASNRWGNMHWGHAVSRDLVHWEELDEALYPDSLGTMYSGSAIVDTENRTGLKENENDVILLYYTAAGNHGRLSEGKKYTQCLAYSTDGGMTFRKYDKNPIIGHIEGGNRDPKVVYCEDIGKYLMALYLSESRYLLLVSLDLINWDKLQEVNIAGDNECPDLYHLKVTNLPGQPKKWVFIGAHDVYLVGDFAEGKFHAVQSPKNLSYLDKISYAAQSFSNLDDGRSIRMAWERANCPTPQFSEQLGFPCELSLRICDGLYYLCANPVEEIKQLYKSTIEEDNFDVYDIPFAAPLEKCAYDISIEAEYKYSGKLTVGIFGAKIVCDFGNNRITMPKGNAPISCLRDKMKIRLLVDRCTIKLFSDCGGAYIVNAFVSDFNLPELKLEADSPMVISKLSMSALESIWR